MPNWSRVLGSSLLFLTLLACGAAEPRLGAEPNTQDGASRAKKRRVARPELDPAQIIFSLRGREEEFAVCAGDSGVPGTAQVSWRVTRSGSVKDARVVKSSLPKALNECVLDKVSELKFTRSSQSSSAHFTFVFGLERSATAGGAEDARRGSRRRSEKPKQEPGVAIDAGSPGFLEPGEIANVVESGFRLYAHCYRDGLARRPGLGGAVRLNFVIDPTGAVERVADGGSDLPDRRVIDCVAQGFFALSFPKPERGRVHVLYRIVFDAS
jgi:hypothetical protein